MSPRLMTILIALCWTLFSQHPFEPGEPVQIPCWTRYSWCGQDLQCRKEGAKNFPLTTAYLLHTAMRVSWWLIFNMVHVLFSRATSTWLPACTSTSFFSHPGQRTLHFSLLNFLRCLLPQFQVALRPSELKLFHLACQPLSFNLLSSTMRMHLLSSCRWLIMLLNSISPSLLLEPSGPANFHLT